MKLHWNMLFLFIISGNEQREPSSHETEECWYGAKQPKSLDLQADSAGQHAGYQEGAQPLWPTQPRTLHRKISHPGEGVTGLKDRNQYSVVLWHHPDHTIEEETKILKGSDFQLYLGIFFHFCLFTQMYQWTWHFVKRVFFPFLLKKPP